MPEDLLLVERKGNICTLIINRPEKRNSLNPEIMHKLGDTLRALKDDSEVRAVVIRGMGQEAFSSGFDIGRISTGPGAPRPRAVVDYGLESLITYPYPTIAMIYGYCVGLGLELAVTCDFRIAADTARLGITPAKLGLVYGHIGVQKLLNLVGLAGTKELLFTGRIIDAQRAKEIRLVDYVVPAADLETITYALAQEMGENAPLSLSGTKTIISTLLKYQKYSAEDMALMEGLIQQAQQSEDLKEGQRAFMEKRKPKWVGR